MMKIILAVVLAFIAIRILFGAVFWVFHPHVLISILLILLIIGLIRWLKSGNLQNRQFNGPNRSEQTSKQDLTSHYQESGLSKDDIKLFRQNMSEAKRQIDNWEGQAKTSEDLETIEMVTGGLEAAKNTFKYIVAHPKEATKQDQFLFKDLPNMSNLTSKLAAMREEVGGRHQREVDMTETLLVIKTLSQKIADNYHDLLMSDVNVIKGEVNYG